MKKNKITVHTIVKNEEQWVWYALMSVIKMVDKILVFDTGSTDKTVSIIKSIKSPKIIFEQKGKVNAQSLVKLRQEQIKRTGTDWFMLVDGDEVWSKTSLEKALYNVNKASSDIWALVVRTRNCVGDVWRYQPESAGKYELLARKGHFNIRFYRKLPTFSWQGEYPFEAYNDGKGISIQDQQKHLRFVNIYYWHLTHLKRSSKPKDVLGRFNKRKLEWGIGVSKKELPEVFFMKRPKLVPSWQMKYSYQDKLKAKIITPFKTIKRLMKP